MNTFAKLALAAATLLVTVRVIKAISAPPAHEILCGGHDRLGQYEWVYSRSSNMFGQATEGWAKLYR